MTFVSVRIVCNCAECSEKLQWEAVDIRAAEAAMMHVEIHKSARDKGWSFDGKNPAFCPEHVGLSDRGTRPEEVMSR